MARPRLIAFTPERRLLGSASTAAATRLLVMDAAPAPEPDAQRFYEQSSDQEPRQIQVRAARRGQVVELGHIIVERGKVADVLDDLIKIEAAAP